MPDRNMVASDALPMRAENAGLDAFKRDGVWFARNPHVPSPGDNWYRVTDADERIKLEEAAAAKGYYGRTE